MEQRWKKHESQAYTQWIVVSEAGFGEPPTAAYCKQIREKFGFTFPVVYDPSGALHTALGLTSKNDWSIVLGAGATLKLVAKYADQAGAVEPLLEDLLSAP